MLGFGGHFLTKSRHYSVTFRVLRQARVAWQTTDEPSAGDDTVAVVSLLEYVGAGWLNSGDALLAATAAEKAHKRRQAPPLRRSRQWSSRGRASGWTALRRMHDVALLSWSQLASAGATSPLQAPA
jgi:hypothetical protein